jgi:RNA polymerase II-associated protein 2
MSLSDQARNYRYSGTKPPNPQHLAIALQHADQIQAQKDAQALILDRILELVELPSSSPTADPAQPSAADAAAVKDALVPFQPTDFDNLILERNIEGRCGYPLCPREHRKEDPSAKLRILWGPKGSGENGRGREMNVVPREKLEMWCSEECAERAMYLRVQLAEQPVWERRAAGTQTRRLVLLDEARQAKVEATKTKQAKSESTDEDSTLDGKMANLTVNDSSSASSSAAATAEKAKQLALERGDSGPTFEAQGRVDVNIQEKDVTKTPAAPVSHPEDRTGGSIEGYVPKNTHNQLKSRHEDDSHDVLDNI